MRYIDIKTIKDCFHICILAFLAGMVVNYLHPQGFRLIADSEFRNRKIVAISVVEAKIKYDSGKSLFVDSRSLDAFNDGHIKGALHIPAHPQSIFEEKVKRYSAEIGSPLELVVYCTSSTCGASRDFAKLMIKRGYPRIIYIIESGFPAWSEQNYPVDK